MTDALFLEGVRLAADVAQEHAADVDTHARFPHEAVEALRASGAMSALVDDVSFEAVARACEVLGRHCAATAMVFAMHHIEVACLVAHGANWPWLKGYVEALRRDQRLIASVTSEIGTGGDTGRSIAALEGPDEDGLCRFVKQAPTVSYGAYADDFLITLRRAPEAEPGDQIAVMSSRAQTTLVPTGTWDPLGMRGTCSPGFTVSASVPAEQVLPVPFRVVSAETMSPASHLLWSHLWLGIATEAFERARRSVKAAGATAGSLRARRLSELHGELVATRSQISAALARWAGDAAEPGRPELQTMAAALRHNVLKTSVSRSAAQICLGALEVAGIAGYRNDSPFALGRLLRDSLSASLMVSNDRLHETNAALLMVVKEG